MKKAIAFDLDGTLAPSKSPIPDAISESLGRLLNVFHVCVISGGKFEQFETQLLSRLEATPVQLQRLHIMPTCGTRYYVYDTTQGDWIQVYAEDFTPRQKADIITALNKGIKKFGHTPKKLWGEQIEDRGSQITFSALGQKAPVEEKELWDPTNEKKVELRDFVASLIPQFDVRTGGATSIDVTKKGIDKAHGMRKLMEVLEIGKEDILFLGDKLKEGGNDYPVKALGIDSLEVSHWQETHSLLTAILHVV